MNKQQIVASLAAILLAGVVVGVPLLVASARRDFHAYFAARSREIGNDLIRKTNSEYLNAMPSQLSEKLSEFLSSPATLENVTITQGRTFWKGRQLSGELLLSNQNSEQLLIQLCSDPQPDKFRVLGFKALSTNSPAQP